MAWEDLKQAVAAIITDNSNNDIRGELLRDLINDSIIPQLGQDTYKGLAVPATAPGALQNNVHYIAETNGVYANFDGIVVSDEVVILKLVDGIWTKERIISKQDGGVVIRQSGNKTDLAVSFVGEDGDWHNTPNAPVIDTIPIGIINTGNIENDSKEGRNVGVWYKTANAAILADFDTAFTGFSGQILFTSIPPNNKVCLIWCIYYKLSNVIVASPTPFVKDYVINLLPVLTLLGGANINVALGVAYVDAGATALDTEDGDITGDIVLTGTVDVNTLGAYLLTYNVQDSGGANAAPITRTVNVVQTVDSAGVLAQAGILTQL